MASLNERIRDVRKALSLSQKDFAETIGVSQRAISWGEQPGNNVQDSTIKSICLAFSVNETWLRTGDGDMFSNPEPSLIEQLCTEKGATELERQLLEAYFEIDERVRGPFISHLMNNLLRRAEAEASVNLPQTLSGPPVTDADVEAQAEVYRQHLLEEKKQVSQTSAAKECDAG